MLILLIKFEYSLYTLFDFFVISLEGSYLGYNWLQYYNPIVNWKEKLVSFCIPKLTNLYWKIQSIQSRNSKDSQAVPKLLSVTKV